LEADDYIVKAWSTFLAAVLLLFAQPVSSAQAASTACTPGTWDVQATPEFDRQLEMFGDAAVGPSDVWAVGALFPESPDYVYTPLALHFDGSVWTQIPLPLPEGSTSAMLRAVGGTSPSDVWAVGIKFEGNAYDPGQMTELFEHWDGTSWSVVPGPPGSEDRQLQDVVAISPSDVWAVGAESAPDPNNPGSYIDRTLTEHWDGSSWTVVPSPNHSDSSFDYFSAVSASSPTNVWALGQWTTDSAYGNSIQRWDGDAWQIVEHPFSDFPIPGGGTTNFWNLATLSPTNVWFAGYYVESASNLLPVLEHWDGSSWQDVNVQAGGQLIDITASSARDIWMLGTNNSSTTSFGQHWDGTKAAAFPNAQGQRVQFEFGRSLTALPSGDVWAVGNVDSGVYIQHLCPIPVSDGGTGLASTSTRGQAQAVTTTTRVRLGGGVAWKFSRQNQGRHRVADASGMALFDSGLRAGGGSYTRLFKIAGAFPWVDPTTSKRGTVRIPVRVSATIGPRTTVRWSLTPRPQGCVFDVQVKKPGSTKFVAWKRGVTALSAVFSPTKNGTHYFRARLRKPSREAHSGWSLQQAFKAT
jgi:hypothetical protein